MESNEEPPLSASGRYPRSESRSSSSQPRVTPQSSNGSAMNLQRLRDRERTHEKGQSDRRNSPGAILLQERLKEKKAALLNEHRRSTDVEAVSDERGSYSTPRNASTSRSCRDRDVAQSSNG